jgi:hypothetical protein
MIEPATVVKRAFDVRARKVKDKQLVARGNEIVELNEVAAVMWRLADGSRSAAQIGERIAEEYEVSPDEALADTTEFLHEMVEAGFLRVAPA